MKKHVLILFRWILSLLILAAIGSSGAIASTTPIIDEEFENVWPLDWTKTAAVTLVTGSSFSLGPVGTGPAVAADHGLYYAAISAIMAAANNEAGSFTTATLDLTSLNNPELSFVGWISEYTYNGAAVAQTGSLELIIAESANGTDFTNVATILSENSSAWKDYKYSLKKESTKIKVTVNVKTQGFNAFFIDGFKIQEGEAPAPAYSDIHLDFEGDPCIPESWTAVADATTSTAVWACNDGATGANGAPNSVQAGSKCIAFTLAAPTSVETTLTSPELTLSNEHKLEFYHYMNPGGGNNPTSLKILSSTDGVNYTEIKSLTDKTSAWTKVEVNLTSDIKYIRFEGINSGQGAPAGVYLDEIKIYTSNTKNSDINEGFDAGIPEGWTTNITTGNKNWTVRNTSSGNPFCPEPKSGNYATTELAAMSANTVSITTPQLLLGEGALLEFDFYIDYTCTGSTLEIESSTDGTTYTNISTLSGEGSAWRTKEIALTTDIKYIRFISIYSGSGRNGGACLDNIHIYTPAPATTVTSVTESFESNALPKTWQYIPSGQGELSIHDANGMAFPYTMPDGRYGARYNSAGAEAGWAVSLISPELDLSGAATNVVSFYYYNQASPTSANYAYAKISYSADGKTYTPINTEVLNLLTDGNWQQFMAKVPNTAKYVKFEFDNNGGRNGSPSANTIFDLFYVGEASCYPPQNLKAIEIKKTTAKIQMEAFGDEIMYKAAIKTNSSFIADDYTYMIMKTSDAPTTHEFTGLQPNTTYYVSVKSFCGSADGEKTSGISFKTLAQCPVPSELIASDITANGCKLSWTENGEATEWIVAHQQGYSVYWPTANKISANTNTNFELTLSPPDVSHAMVVKAVCGKDTSEVSEPISEQLPPSCPSPKELIASDTSVSGFKLTWTAVGEETRWKVGINNNGGSTYTETDVEAAQYTWDNLNNGSSYYVSVKAVCSQDDNSKWATPIKVFTRCASISENNMPWNEDMENVDVTSKNVSICMNSTSEGSWGIFRGQSRTTNGGSAHGGTNWIQAWNTNASVYPAVAANDYLYMPQANLIGGHVYEFSYYANISAQNRKEIEAGVMSMIAIVGTNNTGTDTTQLSESYKEFDVEDTNYALYKFEYTPEADGAYYFGIHVVSSKTNAEENIALDDFSIRRITNCATVSDIAASQIKHNSATITWTSDASNFQLRYGLAQESIASYGVYNTENKTYTAADLIPSNEYVLYVRAICAEGDTSSWSDPLRFTTDLACPTPKDIVISDNTTTGFSVSFTAGREETSWQISNTAGIKCDTTDNAGETISQKTKQFTDLQHSKHYSVAVRAICGQEKSKWVNVITQTECATANVPYINDFEDVVEPTMPLCVTTESEKAEAVTSPNIIPAHSGVGMITDVVASSSIIWMPKISLKAGRSYDVSIYGVGANTSDKVGIVVKNGETITTLKESNMTVSLVFEEVKTRYEVSADEERSFGIVLKSEGFIAIDDFSVKMHCSEPTEPEVVSVSSSGATLTWKAEADNYRVEYRKLGETNYTGINSAKDTCTITGLESTVVYQWRVKAICSYGESDFVDAANFTTTSDVEECDAPTALTEGEISENSVVLSWEGEASSYEVKVKATNGGRERIEKSESKSITIVDLTENTKYEWHVRALCSSTDISAWVKGNSFTTEKAPCQEPVGLSAELDARTKTLSFNWFSDAESHEIRYKTDKQNEYTKEFVDKNSYVITNAEEGVYSMGVRAICAAEDSSQWAEITYEVKYTDIEQMQKAGINIFTTEDKIFIKSIAGLELKKVDILDVRGQKVCSKDVNATEVEMDCNFLSGTQIVRIFTTDKMYTTKVIIIKK